MSTPSTRLERSAGTEASRIGRWLGLLVGLATLAAVIALATHLSEPRELSHLVERAEPWWIAVALVLQAGTYVALAAIWRAVLRAAHRSLALGAGVRLALAKQFVDQALPSGGISGGMLVVSALEHQAIERPAINATIVLELASYYLAYALSLAVAVAIAGAQGQLGPIVLWSALAFIVLAIAVAIAIIALARTGRELPRLPGARRAQHWLAAADRGLTGDVRLLARTVAWQLAIVALDGATMWTLLLAVGVHVPIAGIYTSFMISSLARTISIVPAGLGVFEGVAVVTLHALGAPVTAALSAALLFRGVSYWLPMVPGFVASRRLRRAR